MKEHRKRSVIKGLSWRVIATLTTISLVFLFTGRIEIAAGIGFFEVISKLVLYYAHERTWNKIHWGKIR